MDQSIKRNQFISLFKYCRFTTSKLETPGLAALEAAALGVPLIITSSSPREYFGQIDTYYNGNQVLLMNYVI